MRRSGSGSRRARPIHRARGRLGHRPVRHVPDREVLAALVPERVLPFASGDSRKRGLSRAEAKKPRMPRWGAERRARPLLEVPATSVFSLDGEDRRTARAASLFDAARWMRLSALRLPSFRGGAFLTGFFLAWLFWREQSSGAKAHRENGNAHFAERTLRHGPAIETASEVVPVGSPSQGGSRSGARASVTRAQTRRTCMAGALAEPARAGGLARCLSSEMKRSSGIGWPSKKPWP